MMPIINAEQAISEAEQLLGPLLETANPETEKPFAVPLDEPLIQRVLTSLQQARQELIEEERREERLQLVLDGSQDGIWDIQLNTREAYWSDRYYEIIGYAPQEIPAGIETLLSLVHTDDLRGQISALRAHFKQNAPYRVEFRLRHKNGHYIYCQARGKAIRDESGKAVRMAGTLSDITERKRLEIQLAESKALFETVTQASPSGLWMCDPQGATQYVNSSWQKMSGMSLEQVQQRGWLEYVSEADREQVKETFRQVLQEQSPCQLEFQTTPALGSRWILAASLPRYDAQGRFAGLVGANIDITDLKRLENSLRMTQSQLETYSARLERSNYDLDLFASMASHDLQAPLRKIEMFSDFLREKNESKLDEESRDYLERIDNSAKTMRHLVSNLLSLSRTAIEPLQLALVDLSQVLANAIASLAPQIEEQGASIHASPLEALPGDGEQLTQLFQNILQNALKYQKPGERPEIHIEARKVDPHCYEIRISDNGIGFCPEQSERIFKPFERLHGKSSPYNGSGIGLAICQRIVERHNGKIWAYGERGKGATFIIRLPLQGVPEIH